MSKLVKLLTNEAFIGTIALTILGSLAVYYEQSEMAGVAVGGIAAMLRGAKGEEDN